ncbi:MAG: papain-like cysteine peptidase [Victivallaceae bacterium]|nr:papain-like cysteine peptidase [Victivallaceae bacterium]
MIPTRIFSKYRESGLKGICKAAGRRLRRKYLILKFKIDDSLFGLPTIQSDLVLSIGNSCRTAQHLKDLGLRSFSSPFDWMMCYRLSAVTNFFKNGFDGFFKSYGVKEDWEGPHWWVYDKETGMTSIHDFPKTQTVESYLGTFHETMARRFENLKNGILNSRRTCFVSRGNTIDELRIFLEEIDDIFPNRRFIVLNIVDDNDEYIEKMNLKNNLSMMNVHFKDVHKDGGDEKENIYAWLGNVEKWEKYLKLIEIDKE